MSGISRDMIGNRFAENYMLLYWYLMSDCAIIFCIIISENGMENRMTEVQQLFLKILAAALNEKHVPCREAAAIFWQPSGEGTVSWRELHRIAKEQALFPLINDYMLTWESEHMPENIQEELQKQLLVTAMMYYRMVNFVSAVLELVEKEGIHACILKGIGLGEYYLKEELRKTGDVDLYVPVPQEFERFCRLLKERGFEQEKSVTDHHISFFYVLEGMKFELEVHKKPINSQENECFNGQIACIFEPFTKEGSWKFPEAAVINGSVPVLPPEENAFYLLVHMLQHFLGGGMGIRMLCDWVVFWNHVGQQGGFSVEKYLSFVKKSRIEGFHYMITGLCVTYLGLFMEKVPWMEGNMPDKKAMEVFLKDIFDGGEFGERDSARMLITLEKPTPAVYLKEFHRQMRLRFQKAGKIVIFWPVLWLFSGMIFIYNNKFLRKTSAKNVIRSAAERGKMLREIKLFEEWK